MYGMVNKAVEDLVCEKFGEDKWEEIKEKAGVDVDIFLSNESYDDDVTYSLVGAATDVLGIPADQILFAFGEYWVLKTATKGYGDLMDAAGADLFEFLENLPNFHTRVAMIFPKLEPPRFEVLERTPSSMCVGYYTHRDGLAPFVVGLLSGLSQRFQQKAQTSHTVKRSEGADHDEFVIELVRP